MFFPFLQDLPVVTLRNPSGIPIGIYAEMALLQAGFQGESVSPADVMVYL